MRMHTHAPLIKKLEDLNKKLESAGKNSWMLDSAGKNPWMLDSAGKTLGRLTLDHMGLMCLPKGTWAHIRSIDVQSS